MDCSLPGSSIHGIFQARVLEWGAIAFSEVLPRSWLMMPQAKTDVFKVGHMWQNLGHLDQVSKGFPPPPFIEELGWLQSMELQRVGHDLASKQQ